MLRSPKTCGGRAANTLLHFDMYRRPIFFRLPDGHEKFRSIAGVIASILTMFVLLFYIAFKIQDFLYYKEYSLMEAVLDNYFDIKDPFSTSQHGFTLAAGFVSFNDNTIAEDPEIGQIKFYNNEWSTENGVTSDNFYEIPSRLCRPEDFHPENGGSEDSDFFEVSP